MFRQVNKIASTFAFALILSGTANAASPWWAIDEIFSNFDGSIQFIQMNNVDSSDLAGLTLVASNGFTTHSFTFPSDLPGNAVNRSFLVATEGFASMNLVQPDYVVPNGFLFLSFGSLELVGTIAGFTYTGLPNDGANAVWGDGDGGPNAIFKARATNYAGESWSGRVSAPPPTPLVNGSFEFPALGGGFLYYPSAAGSGWSFIKNSGIQGNGSAWVATPAPIGTQTAFIQGLGSMAQTITLNAGSYTLSFQAAQRNCCVSPFVQPIMVSLDGAQIGGLISPASTSFAPYSIPFSVATTGAHTITLTGTVKGDKTTFIDNVNVVAGNQVATTTTLQSSGTPSALGTTVTFTATVNGSAPTGTVAFTADSTTTLCGAAAFTGGSTNAPSAVCSTSALSAGAHSIVATYSGNAGNSGSISTPLTQTVNTGGSPSTNVALVGNGGVASASSQYSAAFPVTAVNNNERAGANWGNGGGWNDATAGAFPDYVEIDFNGVKTIDHVVVYTLQDNYASPVEPTDAQTFSLYGITDFTVQASIGPSAWVTLGTVSGNNLVKRTVNFAPTQADRIRINITSALVSYSRINITSALVSYSRITEIEAWGSSNGQLLLTNNSFEIPALSIDFGYEYNPSVAGIGWAFSGSSGVQIDGSEWRAALPPNGAQTAFIQSIGSIAQTLTLNAGTYTLSFQAAQRYCCVAPYVQPVMVSVDGVQIGGLISPASTSFAPYNILFTVGNTGPHTITFTGTDLNDKTTFIDNVTIQ